MQRGGRARWGHFQWGSARILHTVMLLASIYEEGRGCGVLTSWKKPGLYITSVRIPTIVSTVSTSCSGPRPTHEISDHKTQNNSPTPHPPPAVAVSTPTAPASTTSLLPQTGTSPPDPAWDAQGACECSSGIGLSVPISCSLYHNRQFAHIYVFFHSQDEVSHTSCNIVPICVSPLK